MAEALNLDELENDDLRDDDDRGAEPITDEPPERKRRRKRETGPRARDQGRNRSGLRRPPQEARIREALEAVALWLRDRGDDELGSTLERDASKMARVLGDLTRVHPLAKTAVGVLADVLEPVRAFGPTLRIVWGRFLQRRQTRLEELAEQELERDEQVTDTVTVAGPLGSAGPEQRAEPWRIR